MASKMMAKDAKASLFFLRGLILAGAAKTVPSHGGELGQVLRISTRKPLAESAILLRRQHAYEEDHPSKVDPGVGRLLGGGGGFGVSDARIWGLNYYSGLEAQAGRGSRRVVNDDDKDDDDDDDDGVDDGVYDSVDSDSDVDYDDTFFHKHIDDDDD